MQKKFFYSYIVEPMTNNMAIVLFWLGLFFVFLGAIFGTAIDNWDITPKGTGEAILKSGSAILGAGVFAVIMKSSQFTNLFQKHIYDVFYDPNNVKDGESISVKWTAITNAMLKGVLPTTYSKASGQIKEQFFNSELEYHFENHCITYDISVDPLTNIATSTHTTRTTIVLSPHAPNPILKQTVEVDGDFELSSFYLNDKQCDVQNLYVVDADDETVRKISLPLRDYVTNATDRSDQIVKMERVVKMKQNLTTEPFFASAISRYIKGATITARVSEGYLIHFKKFGLGDLPDNHYDADNGLGFERWQLASSDDLLLPGQGFILIVVPK